MPSWITYNTTMPVTFNITRTENTYFGNHTITLLADDTFNPNASTTFNLEVKINMLPNVIQTLGEVNVLNYNEKNITIPDRDS